MRITTHKACFERKFMRTLEHFPKETRCPVCNSNHDSEYWLMPIDGTEDGGCCESSPVHVECTGKHMIGRMRHNKAHGIVYCFVGA